MKKMNLNETIKTLTLIAFISAFLLSSAGMVRAKAKKGYILNSDYQVGTLSTIKYNGKRTEATVDEDILSELHQDSIIRKKGNYIFVVARLQGDNITLLKKKDPANPVKQYSLAEGTNAQDMVFKNKNTAYLCGLGTNDISVINPLNGNKKKTIDLSDFADSDDLVEASAMVKVGNFLFVALQRLDENTTFWDASNDSMIVVINTKKNKIQDADPDTAGTQAITLEGRNPASMVYSKRSKRIYIANAGTYDTEDNYGGIEVVDPKTLKTEGIAVADETLGGAPGFIAVNSAGKGYTTISDSSYKTYVVPFNAVKGTAGDQLSGTSTNYIPQILIDSSYLYVLDRDISNPGIIVYRTKNNKKVSGPESTGQLPPANLVF